MKAIVLVCMQCLPFVFSAKQLYFSLDNEANHQQPLSDIAVKVQGGLGSGLDPGKSITELSLCLRFKFQILGSFSLISIGEDFVNLWFIRVLEGHGYLRLSSRNYLFLAPEKILPNNWNHFCFSFSKGQNNSLFMVMNGVLLFDDLQNLPSLNLTVQSLRDAGLILGLSHKYLDGLTSDNLDQVFQGQMSEIFLWRKALSVQTMKEVTGTYCSNAKSVAAPDLFDSETFDWSGLFNNHFWIEDIDRTTICKPTKDPELTFVPFQATFEEAALSCNALGGNIWHPKNKQDLVNGIKKIVSYETNPMGNVCDGLWVNIVRIAPNIYQTREGITVSYFNWEDGQPNGRNLENCTAIYEGNMFINVCQRCQIGLSTGNNVVLNWTFWDNGCSHTRCFMCLINKDEPFLLRGDVPPECGQVDRNYVLTQDQAKAVPKFTGYLSSILERNDSNGFWIMKSRFNSPKTIMSTLSATDSVLGTRTWNLHCHNGLTQSQNLKLSRCDNDQFSCSSFGECLPMSKRCDGHVDCSMDMSDELDCKIIDLDFTTYQKRQPPRQNMTVLLTINMTDMIDIKELEATYTLQFLLTMKWYDNRLSYKNLKKLAASNLIVNEIRDDLWLPTLIFSNSREAKKTVVDEEAMLMVERLSDPELNPLEQIHENYVYPGDKNKLALTRVYTMKMKCNFQLSMFPFDRQKCPFNIKVPAHLENNVWIQFDKVVHTSDIDTIRYNFNGFEIWRNHGKNEIGLQMHLERRYGIFMATIFLPTICLIMVAELTLFVNQAHFEATIMVSLTSMLVMYTLYQSVSNSLPATSYLKMIDIWLLVGLLLPFVVFMFLIVVDNKQQQEVMSVVRTTSGLNKDESRRILKLAQILVPSATFIFCFVFFFIGHSF